jgi:hypothetical protein
MSDQARSRHGDEKRKKEPIILPNSASGQISTVPDGSPLHTTRTVTKAIPLYAPIQQSRIRRVKQTVVPIAKVSPGRSRLGSHGRETEGKGLLHRKIFNSDTYVSTTI